MSRARIVARLRRLVKDAEHEGFRLIVDGEATCGAIRVTTVEECAADDLRGVGVAVPLHEGCGFGGSDRSGGGRWM